MDTFIVFYFFPISAATDSKGVRLWRGSLLEAGCQRGLGVGWRKEQEGAMISGGGNDPIPPFCSHSLRHASVLSEAAAGERASGAPAPAIAFRTPVFQPQLGLRKTPWRSRSWDLSNPAPLDVGAEPGVQKPSLKQPLGRRGARRLPGLSGRGCLLLPSLSF